MPPPRRLLLLSCSPPLSLFLPCAPPPLSASLLRAARFPLCDHFALALLLSSAPPHTQSHCHATCGASAPIRTSHLLHAVFRLPSSLYGHFFLYVLLFDVPHFRISPLLTDQSAPPRAPIPLTFFRPTMASSSHSAASRPSQPAQPPPLHLLPSAGSSGPVDRPRRLMAAAEHGRRPFYFQEAINQRILLQRAREAGDDPAAADHTQGPSPLPTVTSRLRPRPATISHRKRGGPTLLPPASRRRDSVTSAP